MAKAERVFWRWQTWLLVAASNNRKPAVFPIPIKVGATVLGLLTLGAVSPGQNLPGGTNFTGQFYAVAGSKETFDSNVYLQDQTDQARRESLVTSLQAHAGLKWGNASNFAASLTYQPEANWFHSERTEDFYLHRVGAALAGATGPAAYEFTASVVVIDGDSVGPTWTGPGGAPATGGTVVRDRRDATVTRGNFRVTRNWGGWLVRPGGSFYRHDFQTEHRDPGGGYQNYVDRSELTFGGDLGRSLELATVWMGYRFGRQEQARLLQFPEEYDNRFHRILFGAEGRLADPLKFAVTVGPEFRRYGEKVPADFGRRDELNLFVDARFTFAPTPRDTVTAEVRRFEQPGASGRAAYEDSTYELGWRHQFHRDWVAGVGGRAYGTAFLKPALRNDWIFSQSAFLNWSLNRKLDAEFSYTHESGRTRTPNATGREFERHLVSIGLRYNFDPGVW